MLNPRRIGEEAERIALSLTQEEGFAEFYSYLTVDEPAVHLMPLHFLPDSLRTRIDETSLRELCVAAKLEYAATGGSTSLLTAPDLCLVCTRRTG